MRVSLLWRITAADRCPACLCRPGSRRTRKMVIVRRGLDPRRRRGSVRRRVERQEPGRAGAGQGLHVERCGAAVKRWPGTAVSRRRRPRVPAQQREVLLGRGRKSAGTRGRSRPDDRGGVVPVRGAGAPYSRGNPARRCSRAGAVSPVARGFRCLHRWSADPAPGHAGHGRADGEIPWFLTDVLHE